MNTDTCIIKRKWADIIGRYDGAIQGLLYRAVVAYTYGQELPELPQGYDMAFELIKLEIDAQNHRSADIVEKRREAGRRSAAAKKEAKRNAAPEATTVTPSVEETPAVEDVEIIDDADVVVEDSPKRGKAKSKTKAFTRPTLEQVEEYVLHKGYSVDAEAFFAYYESNGWRVGNSPMRSWESAVFTWHKRNINKPQNSLNYETNQSSRNNSGTSPKAQRDAEFAEHIRRKLAGEEREPELWNGSFD